MKLKIEGKLKEGFFEWYGRDIETDNPRQSKADLAEYYFNKYIIDQSAQFGLLQEYADTLGIFINIEYNEVGKSFQFYIGFNPIQDDIFSGQFITRPEAQVAAIEKLNEIINK